MIKIDNLKKNYKKIQALKGVSFNVAEGELFAYLGPNGSGKTTTIRILTGLTKSSGGEAFLNGHNINGKGIEGKKQFGLVTQIINLDNELTINENLDLHGRLYGMKKTDRQAVIEVMLENVGLLERKNSLVKELSGGMKRRLMIARALMHSPGILFLDEPTAGLDPEIRRKLWSLIKKIQQQGTTIFLTTHYIEEAEFLADRVCFLEQGEISAIDSPANFINSVGAWAIDLFHEAEFVTRYFKTIEEADSFTSHAQDGYTKRRVNLEDAFINRTGRRMKENGTAEGRPARMASGHSHGQGNSNVHGHSSHSGHENSNGGGC
ncbi:MAG: ABC transporter ATP-binding protein [Spirochaetes bacterium]|nr:ABC transporter ATP-binding protein [Spirochaetota bacterium]